MPKNELLQPFLKWAGGKRQILPAIRQYIPENYKVYYEPFVGAGAVLFDIQPSTAVINDSNSELINCYQVIRDSLTELLPDLTKHENTPEYYYKVRDFDRRKAEYYKMSAVEKASRIIYLNKTCYNGLFRVNRDGQFNVPFGRYKNPKIIDETVLKAVNNYLVNNNVCILNTDFEEAVAEAGKGDFIYIDPPYDPVSDTSSFTGYDLNGFGKEEQKRLRDVFDRLDKKGCYVLLSNSATGFIYDLYSKNGYKIVEVEASRNINSVASGRGKINELLVRNYD